MNKQQVQLVREGKTLHLYGQINFQTVNALYRLLTQELVTGTTMLDCSKVDQCDSSAISLLLASRRLALGRQISLQIHGMNEQMVSLARLYDVENVLQSGKVAN